MGRPTGTKNIETPEILWDHFVAYTKWTKKNPIKVQDWVGGMAKKVTRRKEVPLTLEGFSIYCHTNNITSNIHDYFTNKNEKYSDYSSTCSRIKEFIRYDQINGGMAGIYNPSITQRLNNLVEKTENKHEVSEIVIKKE